jgi:hypothetical protein
MILAQFLNIYISTDVKCPFCRKFVEVIRSKLSFLLRLVKVVSKFQKIVTECVNELGLQFNYRRALKSDKIRFFNGFFY